MIRAVFCLKLVVAGLALSLASSCGTQAVRSQPPPYQGNDPTVALYTDVVLKFPPGNCNGETLINFDNGLHQPEVATGAIVLGNLPNGWDTVVSACANGGIAVDPWYAPVFLLKSTEQASPWHCYDQLFMVSRLVPADKPRVPIKQGSRVCIYTHTRLIALMTIVSGPNAKHNTFTAKVTLWGPG